MASLLTADHLKGCKVSNCPVVMRLCGIPFINALILAYPYLKHLDRYQHWTNREHSLKSRHTVFSLIIESELDVIVTPIPWLKIFRTIKA